MENMDHNAHSVYLMYYHLIMVVKYRRKVMIQFQKEQRKYGNILPHGMELFWKNGIMILTMCM